MSASAMTTANQIGKPVSGRLDPATLVTMPRTPPHAGFGDASVVWTPRTPPAALFVTGAAVELCVAGEAAGVA